MLLAIDVGNTNTVLGLYEGERLVHDFRIQTSAGRTTDELHALLASLLQIAEVPRRQVTASILASVVPSVTDQFVEAVDRAFDHDVVVVKPGIKTGMRLLYENPREVGADRIVNAVAAFERVKGAVIVVDFGTATTFDVITARAEWRGGVIFPGIQLAADALFEHCAKLPRVEISTPPQVIGRDTVSNIRSGLTYGYAELVDGLVRRLAEEMKETPTVVATGGLAPSIAAVARNIDVVDPLLTLKGLRAVFRKNERSASA